MTEIYDYFRLLYARIGTPHCPKCGQEIKNRRSTRWWISLWNCRSARRSSFAPTVRGRKGEHVKLFEKAKRSGYVRVIVDGNMYDLSEEIKLDKNKKHNIEIVVDRLMIKPGIEKRLTDSIENVMELSDGLVIVDVDGRGADALQPELFLPGLRHQRGGDRAAQLSFNNPFGACPDCFGLGYKMEFDEDLMIPDKSLSIAEGAITVLGWQSCTTKGSFTKRSLTRLRRNITLAWRRRMKAASGGHSAYADPRNRRQKGKGALYRNARNRRI